MLHTIGLLVLDIKKILKVFTIFMGQLDHLYKFWFPLPKKAPHEIWLWKKTFENGGRRTPDGHWMDTGGRSNRVWIYYKLTAQVS